MTTNQSPVGSTPPPAPEEKGKTLERELETNTAKLVSALKGFEWGIDVIDIVRERDAIHSKHYARIEGEIQKLYDRNLWRKRSTNVHDSECEHDNNWCVTNGEELIDAEYEEYGYNSALDHVLSIIAKHTTSSPTGKVCPQ